MEKISAKLGNQHACRNGGGKDTAGHPLYGQQPLHAVRDFTGAGNTQRVHQTRHDAAGAALARRDTGTFHAGDQRAVAVSRGLAPASVSGG